MQKYLAFSKFGKSSNSNTGNGTNSRNQSPSRFGPSPPADNGNEFDPQQKDYDPAYYTKIVYKEDNCIHSIRYTNDMSFEEQLMLGNN